MLKYFHNGFFCLYKFLYSPEKNCLLPRAYLFTYYFVISDYVLEKKDYIFSRICVVDIYFYSFDLFSQIEVPL